MTNTNRKCVVIHNGSWSTVAGFSNMELPQCIIPSSYVKRKDDDTRIFGTFEMLDEAEKNEEGSNVYTIIDSRGYPYNWEDLEAQWRYLYQEHLKISPEELPLVISVPASSGEMNMKTMENYFDIAFNKLKVPVLQILIEPLAIALSMGKSSALVVDIGARGCSVTPIIDGTVVKSGVMKSKFGGDFLDYQIISSGVFKEDEPSASNSCSMWFNSNSWIQQFKSTMLQVSEKNLKEVERYYEMQQKQQQQSQQTFPNFALNPLTQKKNFLYKKNKTVTLEVKDCFQMAECLFDPKVALEQSQPQAPAPAQQPLQVLPQPANNIGLSELMSKAIRKAGAGVSTSGTIGGGTGASLILNEKSSQQNASQNAQLSSGTSASGITSEQVYSLLLTNVIITGSTSLISGMEQRIINELSIRFPQYKLTTYANQIMMDRKIQSWIAMSSMSNLPNWELGKWYSKQDFDHLKQTTQMA